MAKEKPRRDETDRGAQHMKDIGMLYRNITSPSRENVAARRENREILRLLGCSRQDVAIGALKLRSFERMPRSTDHPAHDSRCGTGPRLTGQNSTGHDGPDREHAEGTAPVNHRH